MMVSIDRAGRIVVPKELRDRLGLAAHAELELHVQGQSLLLTPVRTPGRHVVEVDGWPVIAAIPGVGVTDAEVQSWRDDGQR